MSLGVKQLKPDPWESIEVKYPVGSTHTATVRNFTNFGAFVEIEEGVEGLIHISDLSWTKKIKHPSEVTELAAPIQVQVLDIDKENRRLSLGHKQLEENPWDVFETIFTVGSIHEGTIVELLDKGAVISLPYGVEGFATPKHLVKEDNSHAQVDEKMQFKVIEFNKDAKRIIVSHSRIHEDITGEDSRRKGKRGGRKEGGNETQAAIPAMEKTTLGDIGELAALKEKLDNQKVEAFKKEAAKTADVKTDAPEAEAKAKAKVAAADKTDEVEAKTETKVKEDDQSAETEVKEEVKTEEATSVAETEVAEEVVAEEKPKAAKAKAKKEEPKAKKEEPKAEKEEATKTEEADNSEEVKEKGKSKE
jgi:small subunit ribosomal protein S1